MLNSRWTLWVVLLLITIAASVWDLPGAKTQDDLFNVPQRVAGTKPDNTPSAVVAAAAPSSAAAVMASTAKPANLFPVGNWAPPPPKVAKAIAVVRQAPPLPFTYLGKVLEGNSIVVFLSEGDRTHLVRTGDVVANYRVQQVTPSDMTLLYIPLDETQKLNFGSSN